MGTTSDDELVFAGAGERTPSQAMYFDWINHAWEGANEACTLANLDFFKWLHDEYGMALDIYLLDAGTIDGLQTYGTMTSDSFKRRFPRGLKPIQEKAEAFGCRLGMWLGPDGYGTTPEEENVRREMLVTLARDYNMALFKFDGCCGNLRDDRSNSFAQTMAEVRRFQPDLIALNHRINLDGRARRHMTTWLWQGAETYIDVHLANAACAAHHRVGVMSRGLPPELSRLTEDHGVCLSSCLDYWEDDVVLQAFNRCLILAPEIYGNPWLLRDDEFPKLARIVMLHRRHRDILVNGITLPESYGPSAAARGDESTRFVTLLNLTWNPRTYSVRLDGEIGLSAQGQVELRQFHPYEKALGTFQHGAVIDIEVPPFRSCLLMATAKPVAEVGVDGCSYEGVLDMAGKPVKLKLLGLPGTNASIRLLPGGRTFGKAVLDGETLDRLAAGKVVEITFPGRKLRAAFHRKVADLKQAAVPEDAEALYEATCFAADNNALEARSLIRSGPTSIPQVQKARDAFFNQDRFRELGIWDRNLFDGRKDTYFQCSEPGLPGLIRGGALRVDLGEVVRVDRLVISTVDGDFDKTPIGPGAVSADLKTWTPVQLKRQGGAIIVTIFAGRPVRYLRIGGYLGKIAEIDGGCGGRALDRSRWRASMVFGLYEKAPAVRAWLASCTLDEIPANSYLAVAVHGEHGPECAYAAIRVNGNVVGAPDRSVSYHSSVWEAGVRELGAGYTYYIPLRPEMGGKTIDVVLLRVGEKPETDTISPEVWITAYPVPFETKELVLYAP